ncbi:MAG TPA: xanthine dehydrogenase family protein subunit M [Ideonella sp.]|jgi:carbon-monoxide dehydrogenase medium subunit|nr:xanthine dehydrogenase family protein subunit M [Ideonella sp.]
MQAFAYQKPASVADAARALTGGAKLVAGGQSLLAAMKLGLATPETLVDLGGIAELRGIKVSGSTVTIGAMTTHAEVAASKDIAKAIPALAALAAEIGDRQVRNRGTIGGSLANNDPAADYPAAVLALNATIQTDRRRIAADDFFKGLYETALADGEIITAVSFPVPEKAGWSKFKQPASRFSLVGVFAAKTGGSARVAVTGAKACVFRAQALEAKLAASWDAASCAGTFLSPSDMTTDLHGSGEYRSALIPVVAGRAVAAS